MRICVLVLCVFGSSLIPNNAYSEHKQVVLVTNEEAHKPDAPPGRKGFSSQGPFEGPIITFNKPVYGSEVEKPVAIDITFSERLAPVDIATLEVTYLKFIDIDITDRVKEYATPTGIKIPNASLPSGSHKVRFSIKDKEARVSEEILKVTILDNEE